MTRFELEARRAIRAAVRALLDAECPELAATVATMESLVPRRNEAPAFASPTVALDEATRLLGSKRQAREFFNRAERGGFIVHRNGRAVWMDAGEWTRAVDALSKKRPAAPSSSTTPSADDLLDNVGAIPARGRGRGRAA